MTDPPGLPGACQACRTPPEPPLALGMAFQPIVNVRTRETYAYEALVRGPQGQPAAWVFERVTPAQLYHFDQACRVTAIRLAAQLGMRARLAINILPNAVYEPRTCLQATLRAARDHGFPSEQLLFELTEHEQVLDRAHLRRIIETYRAHGFTTALDDYGAGHAGAGLLLALRPDVVKVDMAVVRGVDQDPWRQGLLRHLASFAAEVGLLLIAEGIETAAEARCLLGLGITHMQGYFLARPGFGCLPEVPEEVLAQCCPPECCLP